MKAKSQSDPSQVPTLDNNSSADAHAEMPKISSASSVKSKASNTSVRSKLGSQASLKKETDTFPSVSIVVIPKTKFVFRLLNNFSLSHSLGVLPV